MTQSHPFLRHAILAATLSASLLMGIPAFAQSSPGVDDLRALRFYIEQNEQAAIQAEIRRIQAEFPGWTPPSELSDLLRTAPSTEIADIYARLARGDIDGARRILQQTSEAYPSWQVPSDLQNQIALAEGQAAFDSAVNARNASEAVRVAAQTPSLLRCDRINNTWNLAELQASNGNDSGALAAYRQIVNTCNTVPNIVSTIEKAEAVASDSQLSSLVETAKGRFLTEATTFDTLEQRLLRGRGSSAAEPAQPAQSAQTARTAQPERSTAAPAPDKSPTTTSAITRTPTTRQTAATAPQQSATAAPARTSYGASTLSRLPPRGDGRLAAARAAAQVGNYRACLANSAQPRSIEIAYERAWCAYNLERPLEAMAYFTVTSRSGLGAEVVRDARFGLALAYLKLTMTEDAARLAAATNYTPTQRREIESIILNQRGVQAYQLEEYENAINYFDALEELDNGLPRDLALLRGYAYLNLKDYASARTQIFLHSTTNSQPRRRAKR